MTTIPHTTAGLAVDPYTSPVHLNRIASPNGRPQRNLPLMRKYEVAHLTPSHHIEHRTIVAPATDVFESAFAVMGHGTLLATDAGPRAIEDIVPGDRVVTVENGLQTVMWHGAMSLAAPRQEAATLTRFPSNADQFGLDGPDLVLGPAARLRVTSEAARKITGANHVFVPASDLIDGSQAIAIRPMSATNCYQIGLARHSSVRVNGQCIETLHPGPAHQLGLRAAMLDLYLSLFGHVSSLADFGPMAAPRIRQSDLDLVAA